jgi:hypothetical protein
VNETSRPGPGRPPPDPTGIDAYAPAEIAARVEKAGIGKARLTGISLMALAMLPVRSSPLVQCSTRWS